MPLWLRYRRRQLGCARRIDALLNRQGRWFFLLIHIVGTAFGHCALAGLAASMFVNLAQVLFGFRSNEINKLKDE